MLIEMIADAKVAEDGVTVVLWAKGEAHETYAQLAQDLIDSGKAKEVKPAPVKPAAPAAPIPARK